MENYKFNIKDIEADGWVKSFYYIIRGSKNEWEYKKGNRVITIDFYENGDVKQIFTYSCQTRAITDMQDLNYFFETNS